MPAPAASIGHLTLLAALVLGAPGVARAEDTSFAPQPRAVTLPEALATARAQQPALHAAQARVSAEQALADVPRARWLPAVGLTVQGYAATANNTTASVLSVPYVALPRIGAESAVNAASADWAPSASTLAAVGLTQEVFDFGRIAAQAAAADSLVTARQRELEVAALDVGFDVEEAFFAVDAAKAVLRAAEDAYQRSKVHRDLAQAGVTSGLRSPIELTRAQAELERFDIARLRARGGVAVAQSQLAAAVGGPELALDTRGAEPTPAELPALGEALRRAQQADPFLASALARLEAQVRTTVAVGAELRPELLATATLSGRAGGARSSGQQADFLGLLPSVPNWDVGLVLSWPIYDGVVTARRSASASAEAVRQQEVEVVKQRLTALVQRTFVNAEVARAALPGLERSVTAAVANEAQADARFKAGLGTSVELADAEALRVDAEIQLAIGRFQAARTRAAFGRAIAEGAPTTP